MRRHHPHTPKPTFDDDDFQFGLEIALGGAYRQVSDLGEVLETAARIPNKDAEAWVTEWTATAQRVSAAATEALEAGRRESALAHFRRAATYYSTALYLIERSSDPSRQPDLWRTQRDCWEHVVDLMPVPGERVAIPYEDTTLTAYVFRAPDSAPGEKRPLVVVNNGSDGATSSMWNDGGAAASERGWHWMTFDGPGQQSTLFEQGIPFRPDWEAVLTPVVDQMLSRSDVYPDRMAVIGVSQAGFWVPRALAFEHRFAAAVADPGVVDVSTSWLEHLPGSLKKLLDEDKQKEFDRDMHWGEMLSRSTAGLLNFRGKPYGVDGGSRYELYKRVSEYKLSDEVAQIATPLLITEPEDEQFWPGQSQELLDRVGGTAELIHFTAAEGAGRHCEPMGRAQRDARVFDWLAGRLAAT